MPLSKTQIGRAGELLFSSYVMLTSGGELELFQPLADDDHVDVSAGRRGSVPRLTLQVKTALHLDRAGKVEARAEFASGVPVEHEAFLYAVVLIRVPAIRACWLLPSRDFNRLAYRHSSGRRLELHIYASPDGEDRFSSFRVAPDALGPRLLEIVDGLPPVDPPQVPGARTLLRLA